MAAAAVSATAVIDGVGIGAARAATAGTLAALPIAGISERRRAIAATVAPALVRRAAESEEAPDQARDAVEDVAEHLPGVIEWVGQRIEEAAVVRRRAGVVFQRAV